MTDEIIGVILVLGQNISQIVALGELVQENEQLYAERLVTTGSLSEPLPQRVQLDTSKSFSAQDERCVRLRSWAAVHRGVSTG
jgi:hypothetical protein